MLNIESTPLEEMIKDAVKTFPDECCGFLFGSEENDNRTVIKIQVVDNAKEGDKRRRFVISPKDYLKAEQFAELNNLQLIGVYHSHPNHPAIPSEHDRVAAQPFFSYIILSVINNEFDHIRSWQLNTESQFEEEKIFIQQLN
ncbi:MAG: M67 family metallopeptidase [Bacteroidota bacterium]